MARAQHKEVTVYPHIEQEDMIYLLTAIGLSPGGSSTVHIYTQTIRRTTQITTNVEECGPCPFFASFTLAFALQLRKKHGKTSVRVKKTSVRLRITSVRVQIMNEKLNRIEILSFYNNRCYRIQGVTGGRDKTSGECSLC